MENKTINLPDWVIFHIPHDSVEIPKVVKNQFILNDEQLARELLLMTDHYTWNIFARDIDPANVVRAPVSRLVVDVERFINDDEEPMSARGMGVIYTHTSQGNPLRKELSEADRQKLLETYYIPHHASFERLVEEKLVKFQQCLIIDGHSFPSVALPYEGVTDATNRLDVCIGTDSFHTPPELVEAFVREFSDVGFSVAVNAPFSGSIVPMSRYLKDTRVLSLMVELNRKIYLHEATGQKRIDFDDIGFSVRSSIARAIEGIDWHPTT